MPSVNMLVPAPQAQHPLAIGYLERQSDDEGAREYHLLHKSLEGEILVGRGPRNDIVLQEPTISWTHCTIAYSERHNAAISVTITAKKTTNGTFVNGVRLKAGKTRNLSDGDTISFGVFVVSHKENRLRGVGFYGEHQTIESLGLAEERLRLKQPHWQFKFHLLRIGNDDGLKGVGRGVRNVWDEVDRCKDSIREVRLRLARRRGVQCKQPPILPRSPDAPTKSRSSTPVFIAPPKNHLSTLMSAEYRDGGYYQLCENRGGLSWYHPDFIWLGQIEHRPDTFEYELPSAIKAWSSVYGIPQGLHPLWKEFSSAVYGDAGPDVGPESVLLQGVPPVPTWVSTQMPLLNDENFRREHGFTQAMIDSSCRQVEQNRLYHELQSEPLVPRTALAADIPNPEPDATPAPARSSSSRPQKRTLPMEDDATALPGAPAPATLETPRKRTKRDAHTTRKTGVHRATSSHNALPSASRSAHGECDTTAAEDIRTRKRTRLHDEEPALERPAKRTARHVINSPSAIPDEAPRAPKRRGPEPDAEDALQERLAKRATRAAASTAPTVVKDANARALKRHCEDDEGAGSTKRRRVRVGHVDVESATTQPVRRATRASSNTPIPTGSDNPRPSKPQRTTNGESDMASEIEDARHRRSTRLKSKAPPRSR